MNKGLIAQVTQEYSRVQVFRIVTTRSVVVVWTSETSVSYRNTTRYRNRADLCLNLHLENWQHRNE